MATMAAIISVLIIKVPFGTIANYVTVWIGHVSFSSVQLTLSLSDAIQSPQ